MTPHARSGTVGYVMSSPPADDLELRFTERDPEVAPPDLRAFGRAAPALAREQAAGHDDVGALGDLVAARRIATSIVAHAPDPGALSSHPPLFLTGACPPIPLIEEAREPSVPTPDFALGGSIRGHFVWLPERAATRRSAPASAAILAVSLSLGLPDPAHASPAPVGAAAPPTLPAEPSLPPDPSASPIPEGPAIPPSNPSVSTGAPPLDRLLSMLRGQEVTVYLASQSIMGRIISVEGDAVAMIDNDRGGRIALIPKAAIRDVRGSIPPTPPEALPSGTAPIAGGAVLVGFGAPTMISALVFIALIPSSTSVWLPQFLPAAALLGAGIPLLVRGVRQRRAYREALFRQQARLSPNFAPTRGGGWTGGLTLRF